MNGKLENFVAKRKPETGNDGWKGKVLTPHIDVDLGDVRALAGNDIQKIQRKWEVDERAYKTLAAKIEDSEFCLTAQKILESFAHVQVIEYSSQSQLFQLERVQLFQFGKSCEGIATIDDHHFHVRTLLDEVAEKAARKEFSGAKAEAAEIGRTAETARNQTAQILGTNAKRIIFIQIDIFSKMQGPLEKHHVE